jgi:hypothetical protein
MDGLFRGENPIVMENESINGWTGVFDNNHLFWQRPWFPVVKSSWDGAPQPLSLMKDHTARAHAILTAAGD